MLAPLDVVVMAEPSPQLIVAEKSEATGFGAWLVMVATVVSNCVPSIVENVLPVDEIGAAVTVAVPVNTELPPSESVIVTVKV